MTEPQFLTQRRCRTPFSVVHWTEPDASGRVFHNSARVHAEERDYPWESGVAPPGVEGRLVRLTFPRPGSGETLYEVVT